MKRILCYGDSNTFGHDPKDGSRLTVRWPKVLASLLGNEYEILEAGLCGRTTVHDDPYTEGMNGKTFLLPTLWSSQPLDLVILMLGTNDLQLKHKQTAEGVASGVESLLRILTENSYVYENNTPKILLLSPIHLHPRIGEYPCAELYGSEESYQKSLRLASLLEPLAEKYGAYFLNAADVAVPSDIDGLHMDVENHTKLAHAIYEKVTEIL